MFKVKQNKNIEKKQQQQQQQTICDRSKKKHFLDLSANKIENANRLA